MIFENLPFAANSILRINISNTEELQAANDDNSWQLRDNLLEEIAGIDGSLNEFITFSDVQRVIGGSDNDIFHIESINRGEIHGGAGNDSFRFGRNVVENEAKVFGQAGDDYFGVRGHFAAETFGGEGNDRISFRPSILTGLEISTEAGETIVWQFNDQTIDVERVIGLSNGGNVVSFDRSGSSVEADPASITFIMTDRITRTVIDSESSATLVDFDEFLLNPVDVTRFYVRSTAYDFKIDSADFVQFSSELDPSVGNLEGIRHRVQLVDLHGGTVLVSDRAGDGNRLSGINPKAG